MPASFGETRGLRPAAEKPGPFRQYSFGAREDSDFAAVGISRALWLSQMPLPGGPMKSKLAWTAAFALLISVTFADTAAAQQTLNLSFGAFVPRGEDNRVEGDVLVNNRELFLFDFADFKSPALNVEWLAPIGDYLEVGAGFGFATRTAPPSTISTCGLMDPRSNRN